MKPKINDIIYVQNCNFEISEVKVKFLGETSFITSDFELCSSGFEFSYTSYNQLWFKSLETAKNSLKIDKKKFHFKECKDVYGVRFWEVLEND